MVCALKIYALGPRWGVKSSLCQESPTLTGYRVYLNLLKGSKKFADGMGNLS